MDKNICKKKKFVRIRDKKSMGWCGRIIKCVLDVQHFVLRFRWRSCMGQQLYIQVNWVMTGPNLLDVGRRWGWSQHVLLLPHRCSFLSSVWYCHIRQRNVLSLLQQKPRIVHFEDRRCCCARSKKAPPQCTSKFCYI